MKPKNKEKHADEFMDNWVEKMAANLNPTALTRDHYDDLNKYIAENFRTDIEYEQCVLALLNFCKLVQDNDSKTTTISDVNKCYAEKYNHDFLEKAKLFQDIAKQDLLVTRSWSFFDEYSPYGDKNPDYD